MSESDLQFTNPLVRLNVNITREMDSRLNALASAKGMTKSDVLRRALALFEVAASESNQGHKLAITSQDHKVLREIVGIY